MKFVLSCGPTTVTNAHGPSCVQRSCSVQHTWSSTASRSKQVRFSECIFRHSVTIAKILRTSSIESSGTRLVRTSQLTRYKRCCPPGRDNAGSSRSARGARGLLREDGRGGSSHRTRQASSIVSWSRGRLGHQGKRMFEEGRGKDNAKSSRKKERARKATMERAIKRTRNKKSSSNVSRLGT